MPSRAGALRIVAYVPDLLFGSRLLGALRGAGHDVELCGDPGRVRGAAAGAALLIVDLTADAEPRLAAVRALREDGVLAGARTLAFYAHVDSDVRALAAREGVDRIVPRSRIARDAPALVAALAG